MIRKVALWLCDAVLLSSQEQTRSDSGKPKKLCLIGSRVRLICTTVERLCEDCRNRQAWPAGKRLSVVTRAANGERRQMPSEICRPMRLVAG